MNGKMVLNVVNLQLLKITVYLTILTFEYKYIKFSIKALDQCFHFTGNNLSQYDRNYNIVKIISSSILLIRVAF